MRKVTITKYKSKDGKLFDTEDKCKKYEDKYNAVMRIYNILPKVDINSNDGTFYRHDLRTFEKFKTKLFEFMLDYFKDELKGDTKAVKQRFGIVGQFIDGDDLLIKLWDRYMCTDDQGREYGQPHFVYIQLH
ncbi:MAG: hypothetical protein WC783_03010 [Candidatus Paceibacterota bacterium]|jgi:hypothetical protein